MSDGGFEQGCGQGVGFGCGLLLFTVAFIAFVGFLYSPSPFGSAGHSEKASSDTQALLSSPTQAPAADSGIMVGACLYWNKDNSYYGRVLDVDPNHRFPDGSIDLGVKVEIQDNPSARLWAVLDVLKVQVHAGPPHDAQNDSGSGAAQPTGGADMPDDPFSGKQTHTVTYRILAQSEYVNDLKYMDQDGRMQTLSQANVPWTITFAAPLGAGLYVGATSPNPKERVWADIYIDGAHVSGLTSRRDTGVVGVGGTFANGARK